MSEQSYIWFLSILLCLKLTCSYQLIFFPLSERTHMMVHLKLATELAKRNHTVHFLSADCHEAFARQTAGDMAPAAQLHFISYPMNCSYHEHEKAAARLLNPVSEVVAIYNNVVGRADDVLSNEALMQQLSDLVPTTDLLVSDLFSFGMLLAAKLNIQHIDVDVGTAGPLWEAVLYGAEPATSFVPALGTFFPTNGMSFWQRAVNLAVTKVARGAIQFAFWHPRSQLQQLVLKHQIPMSWPYTKALLLLTNSNFAMEPPRAVAPNTQYIGPILPEPPKPLPEQLMHFVDSSGSLGTVLVSFGGTLQAPLAASQALIDAIQALPDISFVWKLSTADQAALGIDSLRNSLPNAYISNWLPQNDLLGHPNVRAFVTQGGYLSMGEAAYHAVPVLGMPFIPGQGELIRFAQDQGRAIRLPSDTLEKGHVQSFTAALRQLLTDSSYQTAAEVVSQRLKATRRPYKELAADWVEFAAAVKDHGPFLHPQKIQQQWYQQVMLDVLAAYAAVAVLAWLLVWRWLQLLQWRLWSWMQRVAGSRRSKPF